MTKKINEVLDFKRVPLWEHVVVKLDPPEKISAGGIILPDADSRKHMGSETGVVVAIGPDAWEATGSEGQVKIGDRVLFKRYAGIDATLKGENKDEFYRVMSDKDIALIIKED